jgi:hypothetical protein
MTLPKPTFRDFIWLAAVILASCGRDACHDRLIMQIDSTTIEVQKTNRRIDEDIRKLKRVNLYLDSAVKATTQEVFYMKKWAASGSERDWNQYEHHFNRAQYYLQQSINAYK